MDMSNLHSYGLDASFKLFRRCVQCPPQKLKCPKCASDETCVGTVGNCHQCASRKCVKTGAQGSYPGLNPVPTSTPDSDGGPNVGAIAGGVIGGVIVIAIATYLIWRFCIKKRRDQEVAIQEQYDPRYERYSEQASMSQPSNRNTQASISTAFTRASNVIQIAFIPGITDRSEHGSPNIPPVPPIPAAQSPAPRSPYSDAEEDHYFMPHDLRDSQYSGFTDDATSVAERRSTAASITPSLLRQSVASTIYGGDVVENPMPVQTATRGRANMVSVKSSGQNSRSPSIPAVPKIDYNKYNGSIGNVSNKSGTSAPHSSPTDSNNRTPTQANFTSAPRLVQVPTQSNTSLPSIEVTEENDDSAESPYSPGVISDDASVRSGPVHLTSAIKEATKRASQQPAHGRMGSGSNLKSDPSPFSDENRLSDASG